MQDSHETKLCRLVERMSQVRVQYANELKNYHPRPLSPDSAAECVAADETKGFNEEALLLEIELHRAALCVALQNLKHLKSNAEAGLGMTSVEPSSGFSLLLPNINLISPSFHATGPARDPLLQDIISSIGVSFCLDDRVYDIPSRITAPSAEITDLATRYAIPSQPYEITPRPTRQRPHPNTDNMQVQGSNSCDDENEGKSDEYDESDNDGNMSS